MSRYEKFFDTLCEVCRSFGTIEKSDELLNLLVDKAVDTMEVKAACLWMADAEKDEFTRAAQKGLSEAYFHAGPLHIKKVLSTMEKEGYLLAYDAASDPRMEHHESKKTEGIASILALPVRVQGQTIGVLSLYTSQPREFSEEEIKFVRAMAEQGAMMVERSRLLERIRENIGIFLDLAKNMNSSLDIKSVLQTLTKDVAKALKMKGSSIRLLEEDTKELKLVASYGLSQEYLNKGPISSEKSISKALEGEPVIVADATTDMGVQYKEEKKKEGIVSILCVPIMGRDRAIGVMRLYSSTRRSFSQEEVMMVSALAQQGGLAIQNASMYLMLENEMKDLKEDLWGLKSWF